MAIKGIVGICWMHNIEYHSVCVVITTSLLKGPINYSYPKDLHPTDLCI